MQVVRTFNDYINIEFRLDKCAEILLKGWKLVHLQNLILAITRDIQELEQRKTYRGADKSLAQPGRKQATATEDFEFHISYL